jgi:hypothetical protein
VRGAVGVVVGSLNRRVHGGIGASNFEALWISFFQVWIIRMQPIVKYGSTAFKSPVVGDN